MLKIYLCSNEYSICVTLMNERTKLSLSNKTVETLAYPTPKHCSYDEDHHLLGAAKISECMKKYSCKVLFTYFLGICTFNIFLKYSFFLLWLFSNKTQVQTFKKYSFDMKCNLVPLMMFFFIFIHKMLLGSLDSHKVLLKSYNH